MIWTLEIWVQSALICKSFTSFPVGQSGPVLPLICNPFPTLWFSFITMPSLEQMLEKANSRKMIKDLTYIKLFLSLAITHMDKDLLQHSRLTKKFETQSTTIYEPLIYLYLLSAFAVLFGPKYLISWPQCPQELSHVSLSKL